MPEVKPTDHYLGPLKEDLEELLARFKQTDSVRYEHFSAIWRDMNFSSVNYGFLRAYEKRHFSRSALTTAYAYLLPPYNFQIRVGGLYLLYGLYNSQLASPPEKICVALKDWDDIQKFIQNAWDGQHLDVIYIYWKLMSSKAFLYSAMPVPLNFEKKRPIPKHQEQELPTERPERAKTLLFSDTTREMKQIQDRYEKMKAALSLTATVNATRRDLVKRIQDYALASEQQEPSRNASKDCADSAEVSDREESSKRALLLASIKSKSYGLVTQASKSRRHRQVECGSISPSPDPYATHYANGKKRHISLKVRTCRALGEEPKDEDDPKQHWLLSVAEHDRSCWKRRSRNRFKWD
ncbi:snRNA-activating protein complex subunit 1a [Sardina pilchardus]|uniref:snRNA-activating protein complex subunit 1a n=1 Tax=Sardina pilchardus TaxID=27697 RepID=UPI002E11E432